MSAGFSLSHNTLTGECSISVNDIVLFSAEDDCFKDSEGIYNLHEIYRAMKASYRAGALHAVEIAKVKVADALYDL